MVHLLHRLYGVDAPEFNYIVNFLKSKDTAILKMSIGAGADPSVQLISETTKIQYCVISQQYSHV